VYVGGLRKSVARKPDTYRDQRFRSTDLGVDRSTPSAAIHGRSESSVSCSS
jgi:hypothetical protein